MQCEIEQIQFIDGISSRVYCFANYALPSEFINIHTIDIRLLTSEQQQKNCLQELVSHLEYRAKILHARRLIFFN